MRKDSKIRAIKAALAGRIMEVVFVPSGLKMYIAESSKRDRYYLIYPEVFCSCDDFLFNSFLRGKRDKCYHLMAYDIAVKKNLLRRVEKGDSDLRSFTTMILRGIFS